MKSVIASIFALGLLGMSVAPAAALTVHIGGGHHRHCTGWGWHNHHHDRFCRHWG